MGIKKTGLLNADDKKVVGLLIQIAISVEGVMVRKRSGDTREKLLIAASDVFVEKGFLDAAIAYI